MGRWGEAPIELSNISTGVAMSSDLPKAEREDVEALGGEVPAEDLGATPGVIEALELYEMAMRQYTSAASSYVPAVTVVSSTSSSGWQ